MEWFWWAFLSGIGFGIVGTMVVVALIAGRWYIGSLREDRSDPSEPYYFMEIPKGGLQRMGRLKHVILNIKRENYIDK
jgi:hypothetical protein